MEGYNRFNILFHKGKTPIARAIRRITRDKYSHCAFIFSDNIHVVTLDWKSPTIIEHLGYPVGDYDIYELVAPLTKEESERVQRFILDRLAISYDWRLIISRFFNIIFGTKIRSNPNKYNCDELVLDALRSVGVNLIEDDRKMTPGSLSQSCLLRKVEDVD